MNIRFYNARILTMEKEMPLLEGELWVKDERIFYVGDGKEKESVFTESEIGRAHV